jgi:hypothetical protein
MKNRLKIIIATLALLLLPFTAHGLIPLSVNQGGTGATTFSTGDCLIGNGAGPITTGACGGASVWGSITGTLSDQTDLQLALDALVPYIGATAGLDLGAFDLTATNVSGSMLNVYNTASGGGLQFFSDAGSTLEGKIKTTGGAIYDFTNPAGGTSSLDFSGVLLTNPVFTFPDATGTLTLGTGTANQIPYWVDANTLGSLTTATYPSLTELSYVKGVTSAIQTQLNAKMTNPMTTGGDLIYGGASGTPTRLANGSAGQVLQSNGTTLAPTWVTAPAPGAAGSDTQIMYNQATVLSGSSGMVYNYTLNVPTFTGAVPASVGTATGTAAGTFTYAGALGGATSIVTTGTGGIGGKYNPNPRRWGGNYNCSNKCNRR